MVTILVCGLTWLPQLSQKLGKDLLLTLLRTQPMAFSRNNFFLVLGGEEAAAAEGGEAAGEEAAAAAEGEAPAAAEECAEAADEGSGDDPQLVGFL